MNGGAGKAAPRSSSAPSLEDALVAHDGAIIAALGQDAPRITRKGREVLRNATNATSGLSGDAEAGADHVNSKDSVVKALPTRRRSTRLSKGDSDPGPETTKAASTAVALCATRSHAVADEAAKKPRQGGRKRSKSSTNEQARTQSLQPSRKAKRAKTSDPGEGEVVDPTAAAVAAAALVLPKRGRPRAASQPPPAVARKEPRRGRSRPSKAPPPAPTPPSPEIAPTLVSATSSVADDVCYELVPSTTLDATKYMPGIAEYDSDSRGDVLAVPEYVTDIFQRLYDAETRTRISPYMEMQDEITPIMRAILVDWIVEIHRKFELQPDTLYLAVSLLDRYLSKVVVARSQLQLVGATALLVASKYEEIYPPEVGDIAHKSGGAYTRKDVLEMEANILRELDFRISGPTAYPFMVRFLFLTQATPTIRDAAHYYLERYQQDYEYIGHRPSLVAAAAVCLALNHPEIRAYDELDEELPGVPPVLLTYTSFALEDIVVVAQSIARSASFHVTTSAKRTLKAVYHKYSSSRYERVASEFAAPPGIVAATPVE